MKNSRYNVKKIFIIVFLLSICSLIQAQITDHLGANWTISSNQTATGTHINVGIFTVNGGDTLTVTGNELNVNAQQVNIIGAISANGCGGLGGVGSVAGGGPANTAPGCSGGILGIAGTGGGYTGGGLNGSNGVTGGQGYTGGTAVCYYTGGGGGGAGAGGSYGGLGGVGATGANAASLNGGANLGGAGGAGGNAAPVYGSLTNQLVDWGSGGGSAGSGGGGFTAGSGGGSGGNGGGKITISSCGLLTITGTIMANGTNGSIGGAGASSSPGGFTYSCTPVSTTSTCVQSPAVYVGAGGAGGGGGGGSGGGILLISTGLINITGSLQAQGGVGGNAGIPTNANGACFNNAQAGAGGGGGRIKIFANSCNNNNINPVLSVAGGAYGAVGAAGNTGNSGTYLDTTFTPVISPGNINAYQTICAGATPAPFTNSAAATLSVCGSAFYQWWECTSGCSNPPTNYTSIAGAIADNYSPPALLQTTYFVREAYMGTCTGYSNYVIVTVNPLPLAPDSAWVDRQNFCSNAGGNIILTTTGGSGSTVGWYIGSCGGTLIGTGNPFVYSAPTVTTTFYANLQTPTCGSSGCGNASVEVNVIPIPVGAVSASVDTTGFCSSYSGNISLSVSGGIGEVVGWYTGSCPGSGASVYIGTGNPLVRPSPSVTTIYYGRWESSNCGTTPCVSIPVVVNLPPSVTIGNNSPICSGNTINLTSGGGATYIWSGPNFNSNNQNPNITNATVLNAGEYYVTVTDIHLCSVVDSTSIVINISPGPPSGAIADRSNFCSNDTGMINLTALGGFGSVISWYSGSCGGVFIGTGASVTVHSPAVTTTYYTRWETLLCGNSICNQVTVVVNPMPVPVVAVNSPACTGSTVNLFASGGATYQWTGPNGFASVSPNPVIPFVSVVSTGRYYVTITSTGACSLIDSLDLVVNPSPVSIVSNNSPVCYGDTLKLFGDSIGNIAHWAWSGPNVFNSSLQNPLVTNVTTAASGTYSLLVTNIFGCTNSTSMLVTIPSKLSVSVPSDQHLCNGTSINISANASGGSVPYTYYWGDSLSTPTISITPTHDSIYTVKVVDAIGCTTQGNVHIFVPSPVQLHLYTNKDTICKHSSAIITANITHGIGAPYLVYLSDGTIISPPWTVSPDSSQTYIITAKDGCGFKSTDTIRIIVVPAPDVIFTSDVSAGCQALPVRFNDEDQFAGQHYFWNFGDGYTDETDTQNPNHIYQSDGVFNVTLTVTSPLGCVTSVTQNDMITVFKRPEAIFSPDNEMISIINPYIHFNNKSLFAAIYYWSFDDGDSSNIESPTHEFKNIGSYNVQLVAESVNGCMDTTMKQVKVLQEYTFYAPTAFSPDKDGKNDIFTVFANGVDPNSFEMIIYDRWGEIVYQTKQYDVSDPFKYGWDGSIKGQSDAVRTDVYTWLVIYQDTRGVEHRNAGTVTVIK